MIRTTVIGNVTKDIDLKTDAQGRACASFDLASHRLYRDAEGVYPVDYIPVRVHGRLAELCAKRIGKGSLVAASGDQETYLAKDDPTRKEHVLVARAVQFLLPKKGGVKPAEEIPAESSALAQNFDLVDPEQVREAEPSVDEE